MVAPNHTRCKTRRRQSLVEHHGIFVWTRQIGQAGQVPKILLNPEHLHMVCTGAGGGRGGCCWQRKKYRSGVKWSVRRQRVGVGLSISGGFLKGPWWQSDKKTA